MPNVVKHPAPDNARTLKSVSWLADLVGMDYRTVKKRLAGVEPDGKVRGAPGYIPKNALPHVFAANVPAADDDEEFDFEKLPAKERLDWVKSEHELMKLKERAGELIPVEDVREEFSDMVKMMVTYLETLPDILERDAGLTPQQVEHVVKSSDKLRQQMYEANAAAAAA